MRPVDAKFPDSQEFGAGATQGVAANPDPNSGTGYLVYLYGNYQPDGHAGKDIACPVGTPIHAIKAGTVVWADWDVNLPGGPNDWSSRWFFYQHFGGRITLIQHGPSDFTAYAHQSQFFVTAGQQVNEGDVIGLSGDSSGGNDGVLAPHLHTEHLVDLGYSTGNGLIYGRTDPTPYFGNSTPTSGGFLMALTDKQQDDLYWILCAQDGRQFLQKLIADGVFAALDGKVRQSAIQAEAVAARSAALSVPAILNAQFALADGSKTSMPGVLDKIYSKPAAASTVTAAASIDVEALVARLKSELPPAIVADLAAQLTKP